MANKKVGLVLGGGGSKGFAHIAVYKVLKENGIPIDCISACSIGAVVAAAIALGRSPEEIMDALGDFAQKGNSLIRMGNLGVSQGSLLDGQEEASFVEKLVPRTATFEDTKIPLVLNAIDLEKGEEVALSSGNLFEAVMASAAMPGLYRPVFRDGRLLVDGGILNSLPVNHIEKFSPDVTIAVDLKSYYTEQNISAFIYHFYMQDAEAKEDNLQLKKNLFREALLRFEFPFFVMLRSVAIAADESSKRLLELHKPSIVIRPDLSEFSLVDTKDYQKIYDRGAEAAKKQVEEIKKLI